MKNDKNIKNKVINQCDVFAHNFFVFLCECFDIMTTSRRYQSIGSWESALNDIRHKELFDKLKAKRTLRELRNKKWLEMRKKGKEIELRLTSKGEKKLLKMQMQRQKINMPDKQLCYVFYDFPVGANKAKDQFRYYLKQCGFKRLQDSVWISKKDIVEYFRALVNRLSFSKWVKIVVGFDCSA